MPLNIRQSAFIFIVLVNMAAISCQVNEMAFLIAKIGSLQKCDIQVEFSIIMLIMSESNFLVFKMAHCPRDQHLQTLLNGVLEVLADLGKSVAVVDMEGKNDTLKLYETSPRCIMIAL